MSGERDFLTTWYKITSNKLTRRLDQSICSRKKSRLQVHNMTQGHIFKRNKAGLNFTFSKLVAHQRRKPSLLSSQS